jgi:hypothetical protein
VAWDFYGSPLGEALFFIMSKLPIQSRGFIRGGKFVATFFHIEKTGGSSIKAALSNHPQFLYWSAGQTAHYSPLSFMTNHRAYLPALGTTFTVVRNPYTRLASFYRYAQRTKAHPWYSWSQDWTMMDMLKGFKRDLNNQYKFVMAKEPEPVVKRYLRFENLSYDFSNFISGFGADIKLPLSNHNPKPDYEDLLTTEVRDYIYENWRDDFEFFKYSRY